MPPFIGPRLLSCCTRKPTNVASVPSSRTSEHSTLISRYGVMSDAFQPLVEAEQFRGALEVERLGLGGSHSFSSHANAFRSIARLFGTAVFGSSLPSNSSDTKPVYLCLRSIFAMRS